MDSEKIQYVSGGDVPSPAFTFSKQSFSGSSYIQSGGRGASGNEIDTIIDQLMDFASINATDGWFGLVQKQTTLTWFGHGLEVFVELLKSPHEERPGLAGENPYDIHNTHKNTHHRGQAVWVGPGGPATTMVISGQSRPHTDLIEQFTVSLLMDESLSQSQLIDDVAGLPVDFGTTQEWDRPRYVASPSQRSDIQIQQIETEISKMSYDTQIDAVVCENPYYGRSDALAELLDVGVRDSGRICENLAEYEKIRCHVSPPYHPDKEPNGYDVIRFEVTDIRKLGASEISPVNIRINIQPQF